MKMKEFGLRGCTSLVPPTPTPIRQWVKEKRLKVDNQNIHDKILQENKISFAQEGLSIEVRMGMGVGGSSSEQV